MIILLYLNVLRQLNKAKQKSTRCTGGRRRLYQKSPIKYNKDVQAYSKRRF